MQAFVEDQLSFRTIEVDQTRLDLAVLILHILQIQRNDLAFRIGGNHRTSDTLLEEFLHTIAQQ